ncbi:EmrB/QacA subfamily drug resistance transporter [Saccharothrix ecbatanensis]|uniref:EmrB/QacA subfamily drug resistance transporter n=1 Tax=Saccharothrix ecbatanensis TaxID=1105145 RepID=A0A7W9LZN5_9PSEU|nr:MFS transporter [Saccharothrix ecbatanensis]MBB5802090.1 EmrB/QacA subfamily drug resistance transporter [Saccharothrix ecbatanensis]
MTGQGVAAPTRRWAATFVVCSGIFLLGMDFTVLNVAVPDLQRDLRPSMAQVQWIVDGYALVLGGMVLATGAITDHIGRRRSFVAGLAVCGATAAWGALAHQPWQLIAARGGMGAGAALLMPATLSIVTTLFPEPALRRRAIALWTATAGVGGMTGPVIGGWLVERFSWQAGFWITVPLAVVGIVAALLVVPESRAPRGHRVDVLGVVLSALGLLALVWAIIESPVRGWTSAEVLTAYATAAVLLTAFAVWQSRGRHPMLPLPLLRRPRVGVSALALALMSFGLYGALFLITLHLQGVLGYSPWQAGLRTFPMAVALAVGAGAALPLLARHGEKVPMVAGLGLVTAAFMVLAGVETGSGYPHVLLFQLVAGFGAGMVAAAGTDTVMGAVPPDRTALGSSINDATRQVGATLGVAVQGSILTAVSTARLHELPELAGQPAGHTVLDALSLTARLPDTVRDHYQDIAREAFIDGMTTAAITAAAVTLAAAVLVAVRLPSAAAKPSYTRSSGRCG